MVIDFPFVSLELKVMSILRIVGTLRGIQDFPHCLLFVRPDNDVHEAKHLLVATGIFVLPEVQLGRKDSRRSQCPRSFQIVPCSRTGMRIRTISVNQIHAVFADEGSSTPASKSTVNAVSHDLLNSTPRRLHEFLTIIRELTIEFILDEFPSPTRSLPIDNGRHRVGESLLLGVILKCSTIRVTGHVTHSNRSLAGTG